MTDEGATDDGWVCQCRRCWGVHSSADAVQYAWEWGLASCGVDIVVGVHVWSDGHVGYAPTYWHGEPEHYEPSPTSTEYLVSFRPGEGTIPTEGDVARWARWLEAEAPADWLIADGTSFRSVRETYDALRARQPLPDERCIVGDWDETEASFLEFRARTKADWAATKARNARNSSI